MVDDAAGTVAAGMHPGLNPGASAGAFATPLAAPASAPRRLRRRAARSPRQRSGAGRGRLIAMVGIGLAILAVLGIGSSVMSGSGGGMGGSSSDYSYYHDAYYGSDSYGPQWKRDSGGLLGGGTAHQWEYQGSYDYGGYGSAGMDARAKGGLKAPVDPLYTATANAPDVFALANNDSVDPTGGAPVGDTMLQSYDPTYNPYTYGYSNPYLNRIRLAYGAGYGRGAVTPCAVC